MNIQEAKEQIKYAMTAYFAKDELGNYEIPLNRQRPVFLVGAPGIGKTAIMEQIAEELGVILVSYSMTHHTRQSALGLPYIAQKDYRGEAYQVSEYTMSEIISSVYDAMEATGLAEGILFLDEINCVSETLTPSMLQFLQYKTFGRHALPEGWIVVTAGNPPEYNRTVREFDIVTLDRLKKIEVEPDLEAWKQYAFGCGVHPSILTYLLLQGRVEARWRQELRDRPRLGGSLPHDPHLREEGSAGEQKTDLPVSAGREDRRGFRRLLRPLPEVPLGLPDRGHPARDCRAGDQQPRRVRPL